MRVLMGLVLGLGLLALTVQGASADARYQRGPFSAEEAKPAPEWVVSEWIRGPETSLADLKGQVVVIDFFQLWCPGCNRFSIPLMGEWEKIFAEEIAAEKLALISIHTVFEGHSYQTPERLKGYVEEKDMQHPVAVDNLTPGNRLPDSMILFDTRGTPEMAIIDKAGRIRFQKLGAFDPDWATGFIRELLAEGEAGS